jgi:hypothetical protein
MFAAITAFASAMHRAIRAFVPDPPVDDLSNLYAPYVPRSAWQNAWVASGGAG